MAKVKANKQGRPRCEFCEKPATLVELLTLHIVFGGWREDADPDSDDPDWEDSDSEIPDLDTIYTCEEHSGGMGVDRNAYDRLIRLFKGKLFIHPGKKHGKPMKAMHQQAVDEVWTQLRDCLGTEVT